MNRSDFPQFGKMLDIVAEQYGKRMTEGLKMLYWQGLAAYDLASVREAFNRHIANPDNGQFMPKVADLIRMMQGTTQDSALIAWAKVDKAVRQVGTGQTVVFDDALIHKVLVDMGGWAQLGTKTEDEWPFIAKEFENRYRGYKMRSETPEYLPSLTGSYEAHNRLAGFKSQPPVLIGNAEAAKRVMLGGNKQASIGFTRLVELKGAA